MSLSPGHRAEPASRCSKCSVFHPCKEHAPCTAQTKLAPTTCTHCFRVYGRLLRDEASTEERKWWSGRIKLKAQAAFHRLKLLSQPSPYTCWATEADRRVFGEYTDMPLKKYYVPPPPYVARVVVLALVAAIEASGSAQDFKRIFRDLSTTRGRSPALHSPPARLSTPERPKKRFHTSTPSPQESPRRRRDISPSPTGPATSSSPQQQPLRSAKIRTPPRERSLSPAPLSLEDHPGPSGAPLLPPFEEYPESGDEERPSQALSEASGDIFEHGDCYDSDDACDDGYTESQDDLHTEQSLTEQPLLVDLEATEIPSAQPPPTGYQRCRSPRPASAPPRAGQLHGGTPVTSPPPPDLYWFPDGAFFSMASMKAEFKHHTFTLRDLDILFQGGHAGPGRPVFRLKPESWAHPGIHDLLAESFPFSQSPIQATKEARFVTSTKLFESSSRTARLLQCRALPRTAELAVASPAPGFLSWLQNPTKTLKPRPPAFDFTGDEGDARNLYAYLSGPPRPTQPKGELRVLKEAFASLSPSLAENEKNLRDRAYQAARLYQSSHLLEKALASAQDWSHSARISQVKGFLAKATSFASELTSLLEDNALTAATTAASATVRIRDDAVAGMKPPVVTTILKDSPVVHPGENLFPDHSLRMAEAKASEVLAQFEPATNSPAAATTSRRMQFSQKGGTQPLFRKPHTLAARTNRASGPTLNPRDAQGPSSAPARVYQRRPQHQTPASTPRGRTSLGGRAQVQTPQPARPEHPSPPAGREPSPRQRR